MPRSRGSELPHRQSSRGPPPLRTSSSESDPLHRRPIVDRSQKPADRRSPRGTRSDSLNQKKLGTRIADLESQLGQAQEELKSLKKQLVSTEPAKKKAQDDLENKDKKPIIPKTPKEEEQENRPPPEEICESNEKNSSNPDESQEENSPETDVFEVPVETTPAEPMIELIRMTEQEENEAKPTEKCVETPRLSEPEAPPLNDLALLNAEIDSLKDKLTEKEKEVEVFREDNESLRKQVTETAAETASALAKEEETALRLTKMGEELEESKANVARLNQKLEEVEGEKMALEEEMKKLRVQTEQWRKAADAAAAVLAGGVEMNGRRVAERCGSLDKHVGSGFEMAGGYAGFTASPLLADDSDDGFGNGKRKGAGMRMFGDLWKKKGQK